MLQSPDHLIKMAAIVQKAYLRTSGGDGGLVLTDAEKEQLIAEVGRVGVSK